jgi:hypothetical protein
LIKVSWLEQRNFLTKPCCGIFGFNGYRLFPKLALPINEFYCQKDVSNNDAVVCPDSV